MECSPASPRTLEKPHPLSLPLSPYQRGSYTCCTPGQFNCVAGLEAEPAGQLRFAGEAWYDFLQMLQALARKLWRHGGHPGDVSAGTRRARDKSGTNRVSATHHDNRE